MFSMVNTAKFWQSFLFTLLIGVLSADAIDKPNIIVVYTDDHGYADLSCQGYEKDIRTPHMDALAKGGARITNGYSSAPQCVPSRGGILTGRYQNRFGLDNNQNFKQATIQKRFAGETTLPERLKTAGYTTGMAGKWHLGPAREIPNHGFDYVFNRQSSGGTVNFTVEGKDQPFGKDPSKLYHIDACSAAASAFIERFRDKPFLLYLAYRAPHTPLDAPAKYTSRFPGEMPERRRGALAMLSAVDDGVGAILKTLRDSGIEERTLIFLIGDNGAPLKMTMEDAPLKERGGWDGSLNTPLNGEKGTLIDGGMRTPFVVYWKGTIPAKQTYHHPVIALDVAATANALAGLPASEELDGVNLIPHLTGRIKTPPHKSLFWRWIGQSAIRSGKWKYIYGNGQQYLFDMDVDIAEQKNVIREHPEIAKALLLEYNQWADEIQIPHANKIKMSEAGTKWFNWYLNGLKHRDGAE